MRRAARCAPMPCRRPNVGAQSRTTSRDGFPGHPRLADPRGAGKHDPASAVGGRPRGLGDHRKLLGPPDQWPLARHRQILIRQGVRPAALPRRRASLTDVQHRLARHPAVEQCFRRFCHVLPRRTKPDLRIDLTRGQQFHQVGEVRRERCPDRERLQPLVHPELPLGLEVNGGWLIGDAIPMDCAEPPSSTNRNASASS